MSDRVTLTAKISRTLREARIRKGLIEAFNKIRNQATLKELEEAIRSGGVEGIMRYMDRSPQLISANIRSEINDAIRDSGRASISLIPKGAIVEEAFRFSTTNPYSVEAIRRYELNLIQQISNETRNAVRRGVEADIIAGRNPIDTARTFRENIGLTTRQEQAVRNYQRALEDLDTTALNRELRDKRFDSRVMRRIKEERPFTKKEVEKMTRRYREKYIKYRSQVIARTESLRAVSIGNHEAVNQMVQEGAIDKTRVRKFWVTARDEKVRASHSFIPDLNRSGVELDAPFNTPLGALRFPRDPWGSAANTVQCRCSVVYRPVKQEAA